MNGGKFIYTLPLHSDEDDDVNPPYGQIAASNHIFIQNGVFFRGVGSVSDKGGVLQLGSGGVYITLQSGFRFPEKKRLFFPLTSNAGCSVIIIQNTAILSGL